MKNKMTLFMIQMGGLVASMAFMVTAMNVNSACAFTVHQPKLPESALKLAKEQ